MKRNLELLRSILLKIESTDLSQTRLSVSSFSDLNESEYVLSEHIALLTDNGYIEATKLRSIGSPYADYRIKRITSSGYDYLDSVRDSSVWNEIVLRLKSIGTSVSLDVVKSLGASIIASRLRL